jgi:predicted Zn-dependent protease
MVLVSAAGPAAGLALGLLVLALERFVPGVAARGMLVQDALVVTIGLSLLNLIPLGSLDGGSVLRGIIATATGRPPGAFGWIAGAFVILALMGVLVAVGATAAAVMLAIIALVQLPSIEALTGRAADGGTPAGLIRAGRWADAIARADLVLARRPTDDATRLMRATALVSLGRFAQAASDCDTVLERDPGNPRALAMRSTARRAMGRIAQADADLEALLAREPSDLESTLSQFLGLYHAHRDRAARQLVRTRLAIPALARAEVDHLQLLEALVDWSLGDLDEALAGVDALVGRRPDDYAIHGLRAMVLIPLDRLGEASRAIERALTGAPGHPDLVETRGLVERLSGTPERAYRTLVGAAAARPELPRARAEVAVCLVQLGRPDEARAILEGMASDVGVEPSVRYAHAAVLAASGRDHEARQELAAAVELRPVLARYALVDPTVRRLIAPDPRSGLGQRSMLMSEAPSM